VEQSSADLLSRRIGIDEGHRCLALAAITLFGLASLAQELLHQNPDVLLVSTTPGNVAAKAAASTIPIVMVAVADPVGVGIVQSLARPGAT